MRPLIFVFSLLLTTSCTQVPKGVQPVSPFDLTQYLGKWHEISRLDHRFERDLTEVTAHYSIRPDGGVKVINRGLNSKTNQWEEAEGKAYFVDAQTTGLLKVSFFGPFYGSYTVAKLEPDYSMALVIGPSLDYAWILARDPNPSAQLCQRYERYAQDLGVKTLDWISVRACKT